MKNGKIKTIVASAILLLGAGAYQAMAEDTWVQCSDVQWGFAHGYCLGKGWGAPAFGCEFNYFSHDVAFNCQTGGVNIVAAPNE